VAYLDSKKIRVSGMVSERVQLLVVWLTRRATSAGDGCFQARGLSTRLRQDEQQGGSQDCHQAVKLENEYELLVCVVLPKHVADM
jgi:hypothetical protein